MRQMNAPAPEILLFDLGGVLVDWAGNEPLLALTGGRLSREGARKFWLESPAVRAFESGGCDAEAFAAAVVAGLQLRCSPAKFLAEFESWDRGPFPGAVELLEELSGQCRLACLSNNNELHWRRLGRHANFLERFEHRFVSFEMGMMKPDAEIFQHVLTELRVSPAAVAFLDDNIECVEAGAKAGMRACQARGVAEARAVLRGLGLKVGPGE